MSGTVDDNYAYALNISAGSTFGMASAIQSEFATMATSGMISRRSWTHSFVVSVGLSWMDA